VKVQNVKDLFPIYLDMMWEDKQGTRTSYWYICI